MIKANTKLTALEVLQECGIANAEAKFGNTRVRIGGISGINKPDHQIKIQPGVTNVEVIVGIEAYDLELAAGENAEPVVTEAAKAALVKDGAEQTKKAEKMQEVKALARKLKEAEAAGVEYTPTKQEEKILEKAQKRVQDDKEALADMAKAKIGRSVKKVKSK